MDIKVDCKLLREQIVLCDSYANMLKFEPLKEMFNGISELLSAICFAVEEDKCINFKRVN